MSTPTPPSEEPKRARRVGWLIYFIALGINAAAIAYVAVSFREPGASAALGRAILLMLLCIPLYLLLLFGIAMFVGIRYIRPSAPVKDIVLGIVLLLAG